MNGARLFERGKYMLNVFYRRQRFLLLILRSSFGVNVLGTHRMWLFKPLRPINNLVNVIFTSL